MCGESCGCLPRSTLHAYALRSAVGTLSLSTRATVPQPGLFSCAFVGKLKLWVLACLCRECGQRATASECRAFCWRSVEVCAVPVSLQDGIVEKLEEY